MMNTVTSQIVLPTEARRIVRNHRGHIHVPTGMVHDFVEIRISKEQARDLIRIAEDEGYIVHILVNTQDNIMTLHFNANEEGIE